MDIIEELKAWVRRVMGETRYHKKYPCEVVDQAEDYTLSLRPDDPSIAGDGLDGVPIRHGIPGVKVRVSPGARVQLGFENGKPDKRYASLFEDDPDSVIDVDFEPGGLHAPVARVGDAVDVFLEPGVPIPITGSFTIPGAPPIVATFNPGTFVTLTSPVLGVISGPGNAKFKA